MSARHKKMVWVAVFLVFFTGLVLPIIFGKARVIDGQHAGDSWRDIIYDFQTLITGGMAILAATVTVITMEKTDARSERRHRELVMLQLRADRLRVERMVFPAWEYLNEHRTWIQKLDFQAIRNSLDQRQFKPLSNTAHDLLKVSDDIKEILQRKTIQENQDLLDGGMTYTYERLSEILRNFALDAKNLRNVAFDGDFVVRNKSEEAVNQFRDNVISRLNLLDNNRATLLLELEYFCDGLLELDREYTVHRWALTPSLDR